MKNKRFIRVQSAIIVLFYLFTMLPMVVFAAPENQDNWKVQKFGGDMDLEIPDGILIPATGNSSGFAFDYGKFYAETDTGSISIYNEGAQSYKNSVWEFDLKVSGEDSDRYRIGMFPRFVNGKNCDGIAIDTERVIQHSYQVNGSEGWPGINNALGQTFEKGVIYKMRFETLDKTIIMYVNGRKIAETGTAQEITEGKPGIRIWGPKDGTENKKVEISNSSFKELKNSSVNMEETIIFDEDWGNTDIIIPITLDDGDGIFEIKNGDHILAEKTDFTVQEDKIILKKEYVATQTDSFNLDIKFNGGVEAGFTVKKYITGKKTEYIWEPSDGIDMWEKISGDGSVEMVEDGLKIKGETRLFNTASPALIDGEIEIVFDQKDDFGESGALFRADASEKTWQGMRHEFGNTYAFMNSKGDFDKLHGDGTNLFSRKGYADTKMKVRFVGNVITLWMDDYFMNTSAASKAVSNGGIMGISTQGRSEIVVKKVVYRSVEPLITVEDSTAKATISKDDLTVELANDFPRLTKYTLNGKNLLGSEIKHNYVTINTVDYPATAIIKKQTEEKTIYAVDVEAIGVNFDVEYTALPGNIVDMRIKNIQDKTHKVYSIGFPNQTLLSANSKQTGAKLDATVPTQGMQEWNINGVADRHFNIADNKIPYTVDESTTLGFITADGLSGSLENNVLLNLKEFKYRAFKKDDGSTTAGFMSEDFMYRGLDGERMFKDEDLYCKIVITEDTNSDGIMDWQDGANALKTIIDGKINGGDKMSQSYIHVGYNFASQVQNPFLKIGDNMKRLSNMIDGFDQILVFKGYQNEGHDSGHGDFDNINQRAGGAKDMRKLTEITNQINSVTGIHINHSEAYPEANMFNYEVMTNHNAWNWLDQAKELRREVDILNGGMDQRLNSLFEQVPDIGFVYVDTYGEDRWAEARMAANLVDKQNVILGTENKSDFDRFASWVHWPGIGDGMHRFVYHTQKDVYNGSSIYRGGYSRSLSMMSWQHNNNIDRIAEQFYTEQLPQRYLMNHEVIKHSSNEAKFDDNVRSTSDQKIYKDENLIADGKLVFIPWFAEDSVEKNPDEASKIYHWNPSGGISTWTLPNTWNTQETVKLYKTSQTGKTFVTEIPVVDGKVALDVTAKTPYVVYKGYETLKPDTTKWSEGSPIEDTSFNSRNFSVWKDVSSAGNTDHIQISDDNNGVAILTIEGKNDGQVFQTMTDLVPGQKYRASVWAGSDKKTARLTVNTPDGKTYENFTNNTPITVQNCDVFARGKKLQRIWVDFVQPKDQTTAEIILSADTSQDNGKTTFMETRIVETTIPNLTRGFAAYEDFENVDQGFGIFSPERYDEFSHLSQTHLPYTEDTISGEWSMKKSGGTTMRTHPATVRILPNIEYTLEFNAISGGTVKVESESDSSNVILNKSIVDGFNSFTFTTDDITDYIVRIENSWVIDDFKVYYIDDPTPPTIPTDLTVKTSDTVGLELSWAESFDEDTGVSGYKIYKEGTLIATTSKTTYVDNDVKEYTTYEYQVSALNLANTESEKSNIVIGYSGTDISVPRLSSGKLNGVNEVLLEFNEQVEKTSAEDILNYYASNDVILSKAILQPDGKKVRLSIENAPDDTPFIISTSGIKDTSRAQNETSGTDYVQISLLVNYYKFDENNTNIAHDFIGNGYGVKTNVKTNENGINGKAGQFDNNARVRVPNDVMDKKDQWTFSAWINYAGTTGQSQTIMATPGTWFHIRNDKKLWSSPWSGSSGIDMTSSETFKEGEWTHVAFSLENDEFVMYFNGKETARATFDGYTAISDNSEINIGSNWGSIKHTFNGLIDEAKFFAVALTPQQIKEQANKDGFKPYVVGDTFTVDKTNIDHLNVRVDTNNHEFVSMLINTSTVDKSNYKLDSGTLIIDKDYLSTLDNGEHTVTLKFAQKGKTDLSLTFKLVVKEGRKVVDKTELFRAINEASIYEEENYDEQNWKVFVKALNDSRLVFEDGAATQEQVDRIIARLQTAIDKLKEPFGDLDIDLLEFMIKEADYQVENGGLDGVMEVVIKKFNKALEEAKAILEETINNPENITQKEIDRATKNLIEGLHLLDYKANKTKLKNLVGLAEKYADKKDQYTEVTFTAFEATLNAAKDILSDDLAFQEDIDKAWNDLAFGVARLRKIANKDILKKAIDVANAIDTTLYTAKSFSNMSNILENALGVFNDENATEEEVSKMNTELLESIKGLEPLLNVSATEKPDDTITTGLGTGKPNANKALATDKNTTINVVSTAPKTGETQGLIFVLLALTIGALITITVARKQKLGKQSKKQ